MRRSTAELDDVEERVVRCLLFGRTTMDLLCDSLYIQCHQVRQALDGLEAAGLVRRRGEDGRGALEAELTDAGRACALEGVDPRQAASADQQLSADDVRYLRALADGAPPPRQAECEWGVGATRQHLWELRLIDVTGFIRPRSVLTDRGRDVVRGLEGVLS
ncbi:hypothetical protein OF117_05775 [Geodermatophilus sp. YIM 151500]|uniref:hypothetical protein n=1 Tax=Geodermatophilus sp. YIM 151500 TaxID=2984531 RepID=UPI0021E4EB3F|nr:hypothetical protein [Geodermatophilus sp. YIM 151500]MCV2488865.1 hypothetical protein [Geodermatophilus sp. YIM 151500]